MQGPMFHPGQFPGGSQQMGYMPWGPGGPPQVPTLYLLSAAY